MDLLKKCYIEYIEGAEYQANDGWHKRMWEIQDGITQRAHMNVHEYEEYDTVFSGELCELEERSFAAGFYAGLAAAVQKVMEASRCSLT